MLNGVWLEGLVRGGGAKWVMTEVSAALVTVTVRTGGSADTSAAHSLSLTTHTHIVFFFFFFTFKTFCHGSEPAGHDTQGGAGTGGHVQSVFLSSYAQMHGTVFL